MPHVLEVEAWARDVIEAVVKGSWSEDVRVELKRTFIEPRSAARRLAGHANVARGESILWLIGIDEKVGVVGADPGEVLNWWEAMSEEFDPPVPTFMQRNITTDDGMVVALYINTDYYPYVVKNPVHGQPGGGSVAWEVPWREGTRVRTARRGDLVRLLGSRTSEPRFEVRHARTLVTTHEEKEIDNWHASITLYVSLPFSERPVIFPFHRARAECSFPAAGLEEKVIFRRIGMTPPISYSPGRSKTLSETIRKTHDELLVEGSGRIEVFAGVDTPRRPLSLVENEVLSLELEIRSDYPERTYKIDIQLEPEPPRSGSRGPSWTYYADESEKE